MAAISRCSRWAATGVCGRRRRRGVGQDGRLHAASAPAGETWGSWSALGRRRPGLDAAIVVMAGAHGERRVLALGADGREALLRPPAMEASACRRTVVARAARPIQH
jgi:hypothetical protein